MGGIESGFATTVAGNLIFRGIAQIDYVTCIFCGKPMNKKYKSMFGHYNKSHPDKIPGYVARHVALFFCNVKGINDLIDKLPINHRLQTRAVIRATQEKMKPVELVEQSNSTYFRSQIVKYNRKRR